MKDPKFDGWPLVYIASPYTTSGRMDENVARQMRLMAALTGMEVAPICPLLGHFQNIKHQQDDETWMQIDLAMVSMCDAVLRLYGESRGADREVALAEQLGIPVFYTPQGKDFALNDLAKWITKFKNGDE